MHNDLLEAIGWVSNDAFDWVRHYSTVNAVLRTAPAANSEMKPHFCERADMDFSIIPTSTTLCDVPIARFILCQDDEESLVAILERQHLARYLLSQVEEGKHLMLDLKEHSFANVIDIIGLAGNYVACGATESVSKAGDLLKRNVHYIAVNDNDVIIGVIAKAHRRY